MTSNRNNYDLVIITRQLKDRENLTYPTVLPWNHKIVEMTARQRLSLYNQFNYTNKLQGMGIK